MLVTVVIAIPVVKFIPSGNETLAADNGGITKAITTPVPAVGDSGSILRIRKDQNS